MKKSFVLSVLVCLLSMGLSATTVAQDDGMRIIPVEMYGCKYNDDMGSEDLDKAVDKWTKWADKKGLDDYAAWTLTPYYYGPEQDFDVIWLGAGTDAIALGKAQDMYLAEGGEIEDAFTEVLTCTGHVNFASFNLKALPEGNTPDNSVLTFRDCNYKEGATFDALGAAMAEWSKYLTEACSTAGIFHWYPAYGGGGEKFDFKWIAAYQNLAELGADYERYGNGAGWRVSTKLFGHMIDCDANRAYIAQNRRYVQLRK